MRKIFTGILLFALASLAFAQVPEDWPIGAAIEKITFTGNQNTATAEMEGIVEDYIGKQFTNDAILDMQTRLYATDYFDYVSTTWSDAPSATGGVSVNFEVIERPVISSIMFQGNSGLRETELRGAIKTKAGDVVIPVQLDQDQVALVNFYASKGYTNAEVSYELRDLGNGRNILVWTVKEGAKITLEAIQFQFDGPAVFSEKTLLGQMSLKPKAFLQDGAFQESKLTDDRNKITSYYHDRGYIDMKINDVVRSTREETDKNNMQIDYLTLIFNISVGQQYRLGDISIEGNKVFPLDQLSRLITSKSGETVNEGRVRQDFDRIRSLYYENGYIQTMVLTNENRNQDERIANYQVAIHESERAYIENIIISGNSKTKTDVILREIPLEPGDIFSQTKIQQGVMNLYNLQYFGTNIFPDVTQGSANNLMDLIINVEEAPTMSLSGGVSFSPSVSAGTRLPFSIMGSWSDSNFLGLGNLMGVQLNLADTVQSLSVNYTQNWLFGIPLSLGANLGFSHESTYALKDDEAPFFNGDEIYAFPDGFTSYYDYIYRNKTPGYEYLMPYEAWTISLGANTAYRWDTPIGALRLSGGLPFSLTMNTYDTEVYRPFDPLLREDNGKFSPAFGFNIGVAIDNRDIYYDPSKGFILLQRFGVRGFFPFETAHYFTSETVGEYFLTLFDLPVTETWNFKMVLALHTGLQFILPQFGQKDPILLESNKYYIDGMFNARGWTGLTTQYGEALWYSWAELRVPIVQNLLSWDFIFDMTALKETPTSLFTDFSPQDLYFSFGGGIRFAIQQLPLRLLFTGNFKVGDNGQVQWMESGNMGGKGANFVLTFTIPTQ